MQTGEAGEVDVVVEEDNIANAVGGVEAAGGIGGWVVLVVLRSCGFRIGVEARKLT